MATMLNPTSSLPSDREELRVMLANSDAKAPARRQHKPSARAQRVWDRLGDWYGARFADQFGDLPTQDWCTVIDHVSNDDLVAVLILVRERHVTFPPTLPELVALVKEVRMPRTHAPSIAEQLAAFVARAYPLTPEQLRGPWTFLYQVIAGHSVITGLVVDADGERPGYRVTVEDMQMSAHRP
jgi:hypothetical protein